MDMDGTLLHPDNKILPETKEVLLQLQQMGKKLVLASGRSYTKLLDYAKELEMDIYGGYLVEVNGTAVYEVKSGKRHILAQMPIEYIHEIFEYFMQYPVEIIGNLDDGMYDYIPDWMMEEKKLYRKEHRMSEDIPWSAGAFDFVYDNRKGYPRLFYIKNPKEIQEPVNKISVAYHPDIILKVTQSAKEYFQNRFWVGLTSDRWLEIMMPGVTKASGLAFITKLTGIPMSSMIAFGDGENDIEMLQNVGLGIAMDNAFESVKKAADCITQSNIENGIAAALIKHFDL